MTIDTRYQPRLDLEVEVQIVYRNRCIPAQSQNLSRGGMFLKTPAMTIPTGTFIGLEFQINETKWQIDGLVVRRNEEGLGAIFRTPQPELFKTTANYRKAIKSKTARKVQAAVKLSNTALPKTPVPRSNADF